MKKIGIYLLSLGITLCLALLITAAAQPQPDYEDCKIMHEQCRWDCRVKYHKSFVRVDAIDKCAAQCKDEYWNCKEKVLNR